MRQDAAVTRRMPRKWRPELRKPSRMLKEEVDEEDIAAIVSKWTGIPVSKMLEGEMQKLVQMEDASARAGGGAG